MKKFFSIAQKIIEIKNNLLIPDAYVLMFHQINDDKSEWVHDDMSMSLKSFKDLLSKLTSLQIIGINDLLNENFHKNRAVALTFDDGYSDVFNNAYPVIKEMQVPFAVFITTDFIGQNKYMTADQVKALAHDPLCTIGSHSITHPIMRSLPIDLAKAEIKQSKEFLENFIQRGVNYFAYPYGSIYACSGRDTRLVRNAGYLAAFSTIKAGIHKIQDGNKFFIPRINVNEENYREIVKRITG